MVAMELAVVLRLAAEASAAGLDPARDPIPACVATSCSRARPTRRPAARQARRGSSSTSQSRARGRGHQRERRRVDDDRRRAVLPDRRVREGAMRAYRIRVKGTWGHGSMPRRGQRGRAGRGRHREPGRSRADPPHAGHDPVPEHRRGRAARQRRPCGAGDRRRGRRAGPGDPRRPVRPARLDRPGRSSATRSAPTSSMPGSSTT